MRDPPNSSTSWTGNWPCLLAAALTLIATTALPAQDAIPEFDAVSVKPFTVPATGWAWGAPKLDPQHFSMPGSPLRDIILIAYGIDDDQLTGLPDWAAHEFFTITAATSEPTPPDQMLLMLRRVLADRFQLKVTESDTSGPVFNLVVIPGRPPLKERPADEECPKGMSGDDIPKGAREHALGVFNGCTMTDLIQSFNRPGRSLGRPVVDKTGLTGRYYMAVWETFDASETSPDGRGMHLTNVEPFQNAVERLLGLKLVDGTAVRHYLAVTAVSHPGPDQ